MNEQQERAHLKVFLAGLCQEIKHRNKLMGREIMPQAIWATLSEQEKDRAALEALACLPPMELFHVMQSAHDAIHEVHDHDDL